MTAPRPAPQTIAQQAAANAARWSEIPPQTAARIAGLLGPAARRMQERSGEEDQPAA